MGAGHVAAPDRTPAPGHVELVHVHQGHDVAVVVAGAVEEVLAPAGHSKGLHWVFAPARRAQSSHTACHPAASMTPQSLRRRQFALLADS